ncbi:hypothetical protein ACFPRL_13665 [Pseudoclavibacter helvolus]
MDVWIRTRRMLLTLRNEAFGEAMVSPTIKTTKITARPASLMFKLRRRSAIFIGRVSKL